MFRLHGQHWECHRRNERRSLGVVLSLQLSAVRFYDSADAVQTKTIMSLSDAGEWFPPPILRVRRKTRFWFVKAEEEPPVVDSGFCNYRALAAMVLESVGEKLHKDFLEQLRIDSQAAVLKLHVPCDFLVFF